MAGGVNPQSQQAENGGAEGGACTIERILAPRKRRQNTAGNDEGKPADRHIHREQPGPAGDRENAGSDGGPGGKRNGHHQRIAANARCQVPAWVNTPQHGVGDPENAGAPNALREARKGEHGKAVRQRAGQRGGGKNDQANPKNPIMTMDVPQRAEHQKRHADRELIGVDDPDRAGRGDVEHRHEGRQRDIGDRAVHHAHHDGKPDRQMRPVTAWRGETVGEAVRRGQSRGCRHSGGQLARIPPSTTSGWPVMNLA